jgi:hypothetical protein
MATKTNKVVENQAVSNNKKTQLVENQAVSKLTKLEKLQKAIKKAESEIANSWDRLGGASADTQIKMFSLSQISKQFCESKYVTDKQKTILTTKRILDYVRQSNKYQNKVLFSVNDVKLICNAILKTDDKAVKIALKVTKQGGQIKQK